MDWLVNPHLADLLVHTLALVLLKYRRQTSIWSFKDEKIKPNLIKSLIASLVVLSLTTNPLHNKKLNIGNLKQGHSFPAMQNGAFTGLITALVKIHKFSLHLEYSKYHKTARTKRIYALSRPLSTLLFPTYMCLT